MEKKILKRIKEQFYPSFGIFESKLNAEIKNQILSGKRGFRYLRTTSTPCSCYLCNQRKYSRKVKHKKPKI